MSATLTPLFDGYETAPLFPVDPELVVAASACATGRVHRCGPLRRSAGRPPRRHRAVAMDSSYAAYGTQPLEQPDDWGDLDSFRRAAGASRARYRPELWWCECPTSPGDPSSCCHGTLPSHACDGP